MKNLIGLLMCGSGAVLLTASDALINVSASYIIGSTPESMESIRYAAIGVSVSLIAVGAILAQLKDKLTKYGIGAVIIITSAFSAGLTIQATSVDYAANDHGGSIQHTRQKQNKSKIDGYKKEKSQLERKMKECAKDNYYVPCARTERRLAELNDKISDISDDTVASKMSEKVDIGDAVEAKSGLPPIYIERVIIYARAFAVPFLISVMSFGFFFFWGEICKGLKKKPIAI